MKQERYYAIDGLRAFAAIGIMLMHVRVCVTDSPEGGFLYSTFIPSLTHFVYLFLVISAFSVCCGYYDKVKEGTITPNAFYKKRYSRILPFFALLVLIDIVVPHSPNKYELAHMAAGEAVTGGASFVHSLYDGFAQLTLAFNLLPNPRPTIGVAWFLGVIFLFYMLFPFFVFMMDNKRRAWISLIICYFFSFMAIDYFLTERFINWEMTRHSIIYDAPFLALGGVVFLYKDKIKSFVIRFRWPFFFLCIGLTCVYWFVESTHKGFLFVIVMSIITTSWLCYAIGSNGYVLTNKVVRFLSGISMEIYLCHMMCFRAVGFLHLERYIGNIYVVYWATCILTLAIAVCFSYLIKNIIFPRISALNCDRNKKDRSMA